MGRLDVGLTSYDWAAAPTITGFAPQQGYYEVLRYSYVISAVTYQDAFHSLFFAPQRFGEAWKIERIAINSNCLQNVPGVFVFRGRVSPSAGVFQTPAQIAAAGVPHAVPTLLSMSQLVDSTAQGTNNVDDLQSPIILSAGEYVSIVFAGVDNPLTSGVISPVTCSVYLTGETNR